MSRRVDGGLTTGKLVRTHGAARCHTSVIPAPTTAFAPSKLGAVVRHTPAHECDVHLVPIDGAGCPYCLRFLAVAPDPDTLTMADRLDELERWLTAEPSVDAELIYQRIERLAGRKVSLQELANPDMFLRRLRRPRRSVSDDDDPAWL